MTEKFLILVGCLLIFSFFGAMAYIALDAYAPNYTGRSSGLGKLIVAGIKWVAATIGDKITAGVFVAAGAGAVAYFLNLIRKENQAKK